MVFDKLAKSRRYDITVVITMEVFGGHVEMPLLAWAAYVSLISMAIYKGVALLLELYTYSLIASIVEGPSRDK